MVTGRDSSYSDSVPLP